ncbi:hypothetical protein BaRGS_00009477 [Batillaria attramentaria]|uniref:Uncharacterized protein n=1 Tax=Batillaria attramentaria TaxID=370345 RepID=A0ABD0LI29_9CAEN
MRSAAGRAAAPPLLLTGESSKRKQGFHRPEAATENEHEWTPKETLPFTTDVLPQSQYSARKKKQETIFHTLLSSQEAAGWGAGDDVTEVQVRTHTVISKPNMVIVTTSTTVTLSLPASTRCWCCYQRPLAATLTSYDGQRTARGPALSVCSPPVQGCVILCGTAGGN